MATETRQEFVVFPACLPVTTDTGNQEILGRFGIERCRRHQLSRVGIIST
ncbi:Uncharacterised protein [Bordetella pertussis]|nr:Uncharacterised protein [Bordetella pertussis]CFP62098.1 Uncharacterised protein [Bordetella pertussis]